MRRWQIEFHDASDVEFDSFDSKVQEAILQHLIVLRERGSQLGRPLVDTLHGSNYSNMKELRFNVGSQVWRLAFAFDPQRNGIVLVGADKRGKNQRRFYRHLIAVADRRFETHLHNLKHSKD